MLRISFMSEFKVGPAFFLLYQVCTTCAPLSGWTHRHGRATFVFRVVRIGAGSSLTNRRTYQSNGRLTEIPTLYLLTLLVRRRDAPRSFNITPKSLRHQLYRSVASGGATALELLLSYLESLCGHRLRSRLVRLPASDCKQKPYN